MGTVRIDPTAIRKGPIGQKLGPASGMVAASQDQMIVSLAGIANQAHLRPDQPTPTVMIAMVNTRPTTCQASYGPVCEPLGCTSLLTLRLDSTSEGWGLFLAHQRGPQPGHRRGLYMATDRLGRANAPARRHW